MLFRGSTGHDDEGSGSDDQQPSRHERPRAPHVDWQVSAMLGLPVNRVNQRMSEGVLNLVAHVLPEVPELHPARPPRGMAGLAGGER